MNWTFHTCLLLAFALSGCGSDTPSERERVAQAFHDIDQAMHDGDGRKWCATAFPNTYLPPPLARRLGLPAGTPGTTRGWDRDHAECLRSSHPIRRFDKLRVPSTESVLRRFTITLGPRLHGHDGISRIAVARFKGRPVPKTVLVEFRGTWRVVVLAD